MKISRTLSVLGIVATLALASGCATSKDQQALQANNLRLEKANRELSAEVARLNALNGNLERQLAEKEQEIGMLQEQLALLKDELGKQPAAEQALPKELKDALEVLRLKGDLIEMVEGSRVRLKGDVLFDSGKSDIKPAALTQLNSLAKVILEKGALFTVRVDGHTDADPINKSKHLWKDNWDLACGRAQAVLGALAAAGVSQDKMYIAAFGQFSPRATNDTPANKQKNRRVELVLMPEKK
ncbi:MAG: OmpA family protein [Planctomycetota bacterium]